MVSLLDVLWEKGLTKAQIEIALYLALGDLSDKEIGRRTFRNHKSVKYHCTAIYKKLNIKTRYAFLAWARQYRLPDFMLRGPIREQQASQSYSESD